MVGVPFAIRSGRPTLFALGFLVGTIGDFLYGYFFQCKEIIREYNEERLSKRPPPQYIDVLHSGFEVLTQEEYEKRKEARERGEQRKEEEEKEG